MKAHAHAPAEDWAERAEDVLRERGYKASAPRSAVLELIGRQECVASAQEIADELKRGTHRVGIATVYRTLEVLEELRLVQRLDVARGSARFEPVLPDSHHHHHHFLCNECGEAIPFSDDALERAIESLGKKIDATVEAHDVVLKGSCPDCR